MRLFLTLVMVLIVYGVGYVISPGYLSLPLMLFGSLLGLMGLDLIRWLREGRGR
jgi:hypothetical protein